MLTRIGSCELELLRGDITEQQVDAIVNAANTDLAGGGGVDGAIHRAAGPGLMRETDQRYPEGCPTGGAVATEGYQLPSDFVFHAVGPIWTGGRNGEPTLLASAYRTCLELAVEHRCHSMAFPAISTGVYGYPKDLAARTTLETIASFLREHEQPALVRIVLFDDGTYGTFANALEQLLADG